MTKGTLYMVATPIGNLEDITLRALRILGEVHLIAAEDTRHTKKLLNFYGIPTPLTSLHDENEREKSAFIIRRLNGGEDVACVSNAGTPGISDPGYILVERAVGASIRVVPVPGPVAAVAALSAAGLPMDSFAFFAFLPPRSSKRRSFLMSLSGEKKTMVFYESPRRLADTLQDMADIFGERAMVISRELTKVFEEILRGSPRSLLKELAEREIKGEITLVVAGAAEDRAAHSPEDIHARWEELRGDTGLSTKDMAGIIAKELKLPRKEVYREILRLSEGKDTEA